VSVCLSVCLSVGICHYVYVWSRVPYQNVVVGLVSNQLLIQCVCLSVCLSVGICHYICVCGPGCRIRTWWLVSSLINYSSSVSVCLLVSVTMSACVWSRVPYQNVVVGLVSNQLLIQCVCLFVCLSVCWYLSVYLCVWSRVPYQNVVVGLVSNQLLIQCVCALLLRGTHNTVAAEQGIIADNTTNKTASRTSATDGSHDNADTNLLTSTPPLPGLQCVYLDITLSFVSYPFITPLYVVRVSNNNNNNANICVARLKQNSSGALMVQTNTVSVFVQMTTVTASGVADRPEDCSKLLLQ